MNDLEKVRAWLWDRVREARSYAAEWPEAPRHAEQTVREFCEAFGLPIKQPDDLREQSMNESKHWIKDERGDGMKWPSVTDANGIFKRLHGRAK